MKLLITGALGHIGSRLLRELPAIAPGAQVWILDNLSTERYCSLFDLPDGCRYRFIEGDIRSYELEALCDGMDACLHLAAITDAQTSHEHADLVHDINHHGTVRVASACAATGTPLVFASTASIYGTQKDRVDEACSPEELKPQTPYAEAKLRAENALASTDGLAYTTFRFGTIFGPSPGMRFHTAVNRFVWQAVMRRPITVWRTALDQGRPYTDVRDAVRALLFVVEHELFDTQVYNVVTLNSTVREVVATIESEVGELDVEFIDHRIMNQLSYEVSNEKFRNAGFEFRGDLAEGIAASVRLLSRSNLGD